MKQKNKEFMEEIFLEKMSICIVVKKVLDFNNQSYLTLVHQFTLHPMILFSQLSLSDVNSVPFNVSDIILKTQFIT